MSTINKKQITVGMLVSMLLVSCSQEELMDSDALPEGQYPVEIASVAIGGEGHGQSWGVDAPQTRAEETGDGKTTWFQDDDKIFVKFKGGNAVGTYSIAGGGGTTGWIVANPALYWRSKTKKENIIAWFTQPATDDDGKMDISDQLDRLAYVLRDDETKATYTTNEIYLNLKHRLAKVRVYVQGTGYEGNAQSVNISNVQTKCTVTDGTPAATKETNTLTMHPATVDGAICFEANLLPGSLKKDNNTFSITLDDDKSSTYIVNLGSDLTLKAGSIHTVTLRLHEDQDTQEIDLSTLTATKEIDDSETYFVYGTSKNGYGIKVTGNSNPTIYLANASIKVKSGNAIDLQSDATLIIQGNDTIQSSNGAGIFVASGKTVTIQSSERFGNRLTVQAGGEAAGIGGYANTSCGNITINKIRLYAYGSSGNGGACPGIGGAGSGKCGTITIENSTIYTYGATSDNNHAPGIGSAQPANGESPNAPKCTFGNSDINTYRGYINGTTSYADYIGQGGNSQYPHGSANDGVNLGGGSCRNVKIYGWTDNQQKIIHYNADGERT